MGHPGVEAVANWGRTVAVSMGERTNELGMCGEEKKRLERGIVMVFKPIVGLQALYFQECSKKFGDKIAAGEMWLNLPFSQSRLCGQSKCS